MIEPMAASSVLMRQSIEELVSDMAAGGVDTLLMLDTNPVYNAPADLDFATALKRVPMSVSLSLYADETAVASTWMVPAIPVHDVGNDRDLHFCFAFGMSAAPSLSPDF